MMHGHQCAAAWTNRPTTWTWNPSKSLNLALEHYPGTLIFVSHDREFVSSLATRIIELSANGVIDFSGTYDDYLRSQGRGLLSTAISC
jgi:ABC-type sulfate/molybdate transport systems ATPase subunit